MYKFLSILLTIMLIGCKTTSLDNNKNLDTENIPEQTLECLPERYDEDISDNFSFSATENCSYSKVYLLNKTKDEYICMVFYNDVMFDSIIKSNKYISFEVNRDILESEYGYDCLEYNTKEVFLDDDTYKIKFVNGILYGAYHNLKSYEVKCQSENNYIPEEPLELVIDAFSWSDWVMVEGYTFNVTCEPASINELIESMESDVELDYTDNADSLI